MSVFGPWRVSIKMNDPANDILTDPGITSLDLLHRGKVRSVYEVDDEHLLMVTGDCISAYDVVLPNPIPGKGRILNHMSCFWFGRMQHIIPNHLSTLKPEDVLSPAECSCALLERSVVVRRLRPIPYEAVVRGYLFGSAWRDYQNGVARDDIAGLPPGMQQAQQLKHPLFTPTDKAPPGEHDEAVDFKRMVSDCGRSIAEQLREAALAIYRSCYPYALRRGIIVADTKFEFGLDQSDRLLLMDELLTPDSSRFWAADEYQTGTSPPSFDKQYVRDYLDSIEWQADTPPQLPKQLVARTLEKYQQAARQLIG